MSNENVILFEEKEYRQLEAATKKLGFKTVDKLVDTAIKEFFKNEVIERKEVTVKVPKKLLVLVKEKKDKAWLKYLSDCLTDTLAADVEADIFGDHICVKEDYDLKSEFRFYENH